MQNTWETITIIAVEEKGKRDTGMKPIIDIIQKEIRMSFEDNVVKAVQEAGIVVDKDRLAKALYDAMSFYHEGYNDGMIVNPYIVHGEWMWNDDEQGYYCPHCPTTYWKSPDVPSAFKYCPNCGANMDGGKNEFLE